MPKSLTAENHPLAILEHQLDVLKPAGKIVPFEQTLAKSNQWPLRSSKITVFQINVGKLCNQTCKHCHVDAGPDRTEVMTRETMELCLNVFAQTDIPTLDITGGAPELTPDFRWLVEEAKKLGRHVMDRCNLTIVLVPKYEDLPQFLAKHNVEIVASLPHYSSGPTDRQRGEGVYEKSIEALQRFNRVGYGKPDSGLKLSLVYNPVGAFLPPPQQEIEDFYRAHLLNKHGIEFNDLYVITNQPINRFLEFLLRSGNYEDYMTRLVNAYNPASVPGLMCRNTISVSWEGYLYDCDFNQMLDLKTDINAGQHIRDFDVKKLSERKIVTGTHCYACTAGQGSSCGGATV